MDLISKYDLIEKIVHTEDEVLLHQIKNLLVEGESESWEDLDPQLKASLKKGLAQSAKGQVTAHNDVMKKIKKRFKK